MHRYIPLKLAIIIYKKLFNGCDIFMDENNDKLCINYTFKNKCKYCSGYDIKCKGYESSKTRRIEIQQVTTKIKEQH